MSKRRVKLKKKNFTFLIIIILLLVGGGFFIFKSGKSKNFLNNFKLNIKTGYIASDSNKVMLKKLEKNDDGEQLVDGKDMVRGTKVEYLDRDKKKIGDDDYIMIKLDDGEYYVLSSNVTSKKDDVVQEKEMYVRTSFNLLKDLDGDLGSLLKKGDKIEITGYVNLLESGDVDIYKVKKDDAEGYFYGDYLVLTSDDAKKNYDEEGLYKIHEARGDKYGGGSAGTLDYYPVTKAVFSDNKMPSEVYALYINGSKGIKSSIDNYIEFAKTTKINSFVVDIKDSEVPAYKSKIYEKYSPTNFKYAFNSLEDYEYAIKRLKEEGFYVIGRITTFKDDYYALDNPNNVIKKTDGTLLKHNGAYWPSAYNRDVWKFNVELAKEAINLFHFNEIQFD